MSQYEYALQFSVWGSHGQGRPLPEADINACAPIQLVTYRCTDASFTGVPKKFQDICKKFTTWSKFQDISGQLLKFQEFQDNTQAWIMATKEIE